MEPRWNFNLIPAHEDIVLRLVYSIDHGWVRCYTVSEIWTSATISASLMGELHCQTQFIKRSPEWLERRRIFSIVYWLTCISMNFSSESESSIHWFFGSNSYHENELILMQYRKFSRSHCDCNLSIRSRRSLWLLPATVIKLNGREKVISSHTVSTISSKQEANGDVEAYRLDL